MSFAAADPAEFAVPNITLDAPAATWEDHIPPTLPTEVPKPFLTYNFLVKWDGRYVAAVTSVTGFTRTTAIVSFHAGGQPQRTPKLPGQTEYEPIHLMRGITTDRAFEDWASLMWNYPDPQQLGNETQLTTFRKPMQIELYDEQGTIALRYNVHNCWPSEYTALPDLQADANTVALASLTIEHEGWQRDTSLA